ncbi:MAG TPA: hypothetical protein VLY03_02240 [Bacteroidota bacterium]|nr:hypothetical protein [Bacteroidota bacterium]
MSHIYSAARRLRLPGLLLIAVVLHSIRLDAQDVSAVASVDSNHILIGDWLQLHLDVRHSKEFAVRFPLLPDSLNGIQVVRRNSPVITQSGDSVSESASFIITAFDSGMHIIPPLPVEYSRAGDTSKKYVQTLPIVFTVAGIAVDTSKAIKDIKSPMSVGITFAELLPYLIGLIVVAGLVWLIWYIMKKRARGEPLIPEEPPRPSGEVALEELLALEGERMWQRGLVKEYYSRLTDIVRLYIERRFAVLAMESTSDEILAAERIRGLENGVRDLLRDVLLRADLVKFAKFQPLPQENESSLASSRAFVEATQLVDEQPKPQPVVEVNA